MVGRQLAGWVCEQDNLLTKVGFGSLDGFRVGYKVTKMKLNAASVDCRFVPVIAKDVLRVFGILANRNIDPDNFGKLPTRTGGGL